MGERLDGAVATGHRGGIGEPEARGGTAWAWLSVEPQGDRPHWAAVAVDTNEDPVIGNPNRVSAKG